MRTGTLCRAFVYGPRWKHVIAHEAFTRACRMRFRELEDIARGGSWTEWFGGWRILERHAHYAMSQHACMLFYRCADLRDVVLTRRDVDTIAAFVSAPGNKLVLANEVTRHHRIVVPRSTAAGSMIVDVNGVDALVGMRDLSIDARFVHELRAKGFSERTIYAYMVGYLAPDVVAQIARDRTISMDEYVRFVHPLLCAHGANVAVAQLGGAVLGSPGPPTYRLHRDGRLIYAGGK